MEVRAGAVRHRHYDEITQALLALGETAQPHVQREILERLVDGVARIARGDAYAANGRCHFCGGTPHECEAKMKAEWAFLADSQADGVR